MKQKKLSILIVVCILVLASLTASNFVTFDDNSKGNSNNRNISINNNQKSDLICSIKTEYDIEYIDIQEIITINIANIGEININSNIKLEVKKDNIAVYNEIITNNLNKGKSMDIVLEWTNRLEKEYVWEATVDPLNEIEELNENNNYASETISVLNHHSIGHEDFYHYVGHESAIIRGHNLLVNSISGNLYHFPRDLHVNAFQFNLDMKRVYNSQRNNVLGPLGYGWTFNHDTHLEIQPNEDVIYVDQDATNHYYTKSGEDYTPPNGIYDKLVKNMDGTYTLFILDGTKLEFLINGKISEIKDKNDNSLTYTYSGTQLTSVSDNTDLSLTFTYSNGLIETVTDPLSRVVTYNYDVDQNLEEVTDVMNEIYTYDYDIEHRLTSLVDREGTTLSFTYFTGGGPGLDRIDDVSCSDGVNSITMYSFTYYSLETNVENALEILSTIEYNGYGNPTHIDGPVIGTSYLMGDYEWSDGRITSYTDLNLNEHTYNYDEYGNRESWTDPLENVYDWDYDVTDGFGEYISLLTSQTNRLSDEWIFSYDDDGNLDEITDPTNFIIEITYFADGLVQEYSGPPHLVYDYDVYGNVEKITYDDTTFIEYDYNLIGWLTQVMDEDGYITEYDYYDNGLLDTITDPLLYEVRYTYDAENRIASYTNKLDDPTTYSYDSLMFDIASITDPLSYSESYTYDDVGNLIEKENKNEISTYYDYDDWNRLIEENDSYEYSIIWDYDDVGNVVSITDKTNAITEYFYDELNRRTEVLDPLLETTYYEYDIEGLLISITNAREYTTYYDYDAAGRLIEIKDPLENTETREYDIYGRLETITNKDANTIDYTYDEKNRVETITDVTGETEFSYDGRGNKISIINPLLRETEYEYDELGRLTSVETPIGLTTEYIYEPCSCSGGMTRVSEVVDANGNSIYFDYDKMDRKIEETSELGKITSYEYDGVGNLISRTDANEDETAYDYDDLNRLIEIDYPGDASITYDHDAMGRMTESHSDGLGVEDDIYYTYDDKGQLTRLQVLFDTFDWQIDYEYDGVGNKVSVDDPVGGTTDYVYDELNRVTDITNPFTETTTFGYNSMDRITSISYEDGIELTNIYDINGYLTDQIYELGVTTIYDISYTYNTMGRLEERDDGEDTTFYTYDNDDRLTEVSYPGADDISYDYDYVGNREVMIVNNDPPITYTYNDDNQLTLIDDFDVTTFTYDDNGNVETVTKHEDTTYTYDYDNRLIGIEFPDDSTADYYYDSIGRRIAKIADGDTVYYFYDGEDIILEFDDEETVLAQYTHGPGIDDPISVRRSGETYYFIKDRLNSVMAIADDIGDLVKTYTYDAWGTIVTETGTLENSITYTGREYDDESGLYYYRARYYNSNTGRFIQKDPKGLIDGPNLFIYVNNNPINKIDPFGMASGFGFMRDYFKERLDKGLEAYAKAVIKALENIPEDNINNILYHTCQSQLNTCLYQAKFDGTYDECIAKADVDYTNCRATCDKDYGLKVVAIAAAAGAQAWFPVVGWITGGITAGVGLTLASSQLSDCLNSCSNEREDDYGDCNFNTQQCYDEYEWCINIETQV